MLGKFETNHVEKIEPNFLKCKLKWNQVIQCLRPLACANVHADELFYVKIYGYMKTWAYEHNHQPTTTFRQMFSP